jgi:hypothetical protein
MQLSRKEFATIQRALALASRYAGDIENDRDQDASVRRQYRMEMREFDRLSDKLDKYVR